MNSCLADNHLIEWLYHIMALNTNYQNSPSYSLVNQYLYDFRLLKIASTKTRSPTVNFHHWKSGWCVQPPPTKQFRSGTSEWSKIVKVRSTNSCMINQSTRVVFLFTCTIKCWCIAYFQWMLNFIFHISIAWIYMCSWSTIIFVQNFTWDDHLGIT